MEEAQGSTSGAHFAAAVVEQDSQRVVLHLHGELDMAGVEYLQEALGNVDVPEVVLVMSEVTFLDSFGLRDLLFLARRSRVILRDPSQPVKRLIDIAGLDEMFVIETLS